MTNFELPSFFFDQKTGYEKEIFIDYYLSWTLRCAVDGIDNKENSDITRAVQQYSKYVLLTLLKYDKEFEGLTLDNTTIELVETEKQWEQIDLFCLVKFEFDGNQHNCILVFENKMYSPLKVHQLPKYQELVEKHRNENYEGYKILKFFVHCYPDFKLGGKELHDFKPIHIYEISGALKDKFGKEKGTGNALFDEFWYNYI